MSEAAKIFLWRAGNAISTLGVVQLVICWYLAIRWYPGGYSPDTMFLSHLGAAVNGQTTYSAVLFNSSLIVLSFCLMPFYVFFPVHAPDRFRWLWLAAAFGLLSSCGLFVVGCAPLNSQPVFHNLGLGLWIFGILAAMSIHVLATYTSEYCHWVFSLISLATALSIGAYLFQMLDEGIIDYQITNIRRPVFVYQKVAVIASLFWFAIMSIRIVLLPDFTPHFEKPRDREARKYLRQLGTEPNPIRYRKR